MNGRRILVIDDEKNVRAMIELALEVQGYEVFSAGDAESGLKTMSEQGPFDLVLLDYRLPGQTGSQVQKSIFEMNPNQRIILITAFASMDIALDSLREGVVDFLRKPFSTEALRVAVASALQKEVVRNVPVQAQTVVSKMTRKTSKGFVIEPDETHFDAGDRSWVSQFEVTSPDGTTEQFSVKTTGVAIELVKAKMDCERLPGDERFWTAFAEESLADLLDKSDNVSSTIALDDVSEGVHEWLESVLTIKAQL